jgi:hypothetical protein
MPDPDGILDIITPPKPRTEDQRIIDGFLEIIEFAAANSGRAPQRSSRELDEASLGVRLDSYRKNEAWLTILAPYDELGILRSAAQATPEKKKTPLTIEEALDGDFLDFLEDDDLGIYDLRHVSKETSMPDYVASRKKCKDFHRFEPLLKDCQQDLRNGNRTLSRFRNEQQIDTGYFFVLKGILLYIAEVGEREPDTNGKTNARLRCIFDNGTESDMLLRSLAAELYKGGKRVTEHQDRQLVNFRPPAEGETATGYIYVLRSLSSDPQIANIKDLYKIGYSSGPVTERLRNAANEPTYLMAPVLQVAGWQCLSMLPQSLESLLHRFFGNSCLDLQVAGPDGRYHTPREWFIAPLPIIERAVELVVNGGIVNYRYDPETGGIMAR